jgi:hypothetical protein
LKTKHALPLGLVATKWQDEFLTSTSFNIYRLFLTLRAVEDTVNAKLYYERTLANVRDFDFDFDLSQVHAHASRSPRLNAILSEYFEQILPALQKAYAHCETHHF